MKIALTGATGFIGKVLLKELATIYGKESITVISSKPVSGFNCIIYENNRFDLSRNGIECDVLIHAGAYTPKSAADANIIEKCNSNIAFTQNLLEEIVSCKKIINISTMDVYANDGVINEKSAVSPVSLYGMSKLYCEKMVNAYAIAKDMSLITLRIGHVYGPGEEVYKKVLPLTMKKVIDGDSVEIWGDGSDLRSFIHVNDVVKAIITSIPKDVDVDLINVVSGNSISIEGLVKAIISCSGKLIEIKYIPTSAAKRDLVFDNTLLKENLLPSEMSFMEGLRDEYNYMAGFSEYHL